MPKKCVLWDKPTNEYVSVSNINEIKALSKGKGFQWWNSKLGGHSLRSGIRDSAPEFRLSSVPPVMSRAESVTKQDPMSSACLLFAEKL